jgi:tryptophanyl-tRNA synthetase
MENKKRVLSGIKSSGSSLHIGNYFGAVKPQIELQDTHEAYYFIADLHALTTVQDGKKLADNIVNIVLDYLALGLDPSKSVFFRQSDVPVHCQLAIVLANFISLGHMKRMHAYKDVVAKGAEQESINMGLFNYPILMAADILLYKPYGVPVGEDQRQHVEVARDIADSFNKNYRSQVFPLPEILVKKETSRIIGTDGVKKMSKSQGNIVGIFDDEKTINLQIMGCFTDPNRKKATDSGKVEGNPVFVYHDLINKNADEVEDLKRRYREGTVGDVEVKQKLIAAHKKYFEPMRKRRANLAEDLSLLIEMLNLGAKKANVVACNTLNEVYKVIGISNNLNK